MATDSSGWGSPYGGPKFVVILPPLRSSYA